MTTLQDQLRKAISESGLTAYALAKEAGVPFQVIYRFCDGTRDDLRLSTASKIAEVLGMRFTTPRSRRKGRK